MRSSGDPGVLWGEELSTHTHSGTTLWGRWVKAAVSTWRREASGDTSPEDTLIVGIQTPEWREDKPLLFKSPVCGVCDGSRTFLPNISFLFLFIIKSQMYALMGSDKYPHTYPCNQIQLRNIHTTPGCFLTPRPVCSQPSADRGTTDQPRRLELRGTEKCKHQFGC